MKKTIPEQFGERIAREHPGCARTACPHLATAMPVLELRHLPDTEGAPMVLGIGVCPEHQPEDAQAWITDAGWEQLAAGYMIGGRPMPVRALTGVRYEPLPAGRA